MNAWEVIAKFHAHLAALHPSATVNTYVGQLKTFGQHCEEQSIEPLRLSRGQAFAYVSAMASRYEGRPYSLCLKVRSLKQLYAYLLDTGHIYVNPCASLKEPSLGRRLPKRNLSEQEASAILEQPDLSTPLGLRDRAILEVLYGSGLRRGAFLSLTVNDLDLDGGTVAVRRNKGGKGEVTPLTHPAVEFLKVYVQRIRPQLSALAVLPCDALFLNSKGGRLQWGVLALLIRHYAKAAGLTKSVSPHSFRHGCATALVRRGADVRFVQSLLGHVFPSTTQVYVHVAGVEVQETLRQRHPRYSQPEDLTPRIERFQ